MNPKFCKNLILKYSHGKFCPTFLVIFGRSEAMKDIFLKLISLQRMETHLGIFALVTKASIPGGTIVAIGTALIVDPKLVNHVVCTKGIETLVRSYELA